jgi:hypothetical protein
MLNRLRDLIESAQERSKAGLRTASATVNRSHELRVRMRQLREEMSRTRKLSRQLRSRKPPA